MKIYNPTTEEIAQDYCLRNYKFKAQESRTVPDDAGEHLLRKCKIFGLVGLDYSDEDEAKYGSLESYKKARAIEGLSNKLLFLVDCKKQEAYGVKESIEKNASPEIAMAFKVEEFERQIQIVRNQIAALQGAISQKEEVIPVREVAPKRVVHRRRRRVQPKLIEKVEEVTVI